MIHFYGLLDYSIIYFILNYTFRYNAALFPFYTNFFIFAIPCRSFRTTYTILYCSFYVIFTFYITHIYVSNKFQPLHFHIFSIFIFRLQSDSLFVHLSFRFNFLFVLIFILFLPSSFHLVHIQLFNINLFPFICPFFSNFFFYFDYRSLSWISIRKTLNVWGYCFCCSSFYRHLRIVKKVCVYDNNRNRLMIVKTTEENRGKKRP